MEAVDIGARDTYGNVANVSLTATVTIQPSGTVPEGTILPNLENSPVQVTLNRGTARLPRLTLCSRVGNYIGEYMLVFSAPGIEPYSLKFAFSTGTSINVYSLFLVKMKRVFCFPRRKKRASLVAIREARSRGGGLPEKMTRVLVVPFRG